MIKNFIQVLTLLLSIPTILNAQSDFRKGYVVTNSNDTLYGLIAFKGYVRNSISCSFKQSENDSITIFTPPNIKGYRFIDDKYYVSRVVQTKEGEKNLFLEYLINGKANIYYYRDNVGEHYLIDKQGGPLKEIVYHEEVIVVDHVTRLRESTIHIGLLKTYLSDCPKIYKRIEKLKKPDHDNMIGLAKDYHHIVCNNDSCIIYEKKKPPVSIAVEPTIGLIKYNGGKQFYPENGILLHFWLPLSSEKLYFKTGYLHSEPTLNEENSEVRYIIHKVPLQLEYLVSGKVFQPKFSFGINFYSITQEGETYFQTFGIGFSVKAFKGVYFSSNLNAEWTPILRSFVSDEKREWVSYSMNMGVYIRF